MIGWFRRRAARKSIASSEELFRELFGGRESKSGVEVNWRTALETTTVLACARVIAEGLAQLPLKLFRERPSGGRDPAKDEPMYDVLHRRPNEIQTSFEFREQMGLHLVLAGNFFAFKNRIRGTVSELLPFEPGSVTVDRPNDSGDVQYVVTLGGQRHAVPAADMWHVRGPSWNGWMGLEGVKLAREAIGLALATEEHGARLFANGAQIRGMLTTDGFLKDDQVKALRKAWTETYAGVENAGKTAILWGGLKWSAMALPSDQAQMVETRGFQVEEICRWARVFPIMVGHADKAMTYASSEQMFLAHVVHTLGPWIERIEQSIDVNLLTTEQRRDGLYAKFVVHGLLRGAMRDRAEFYRQMYGIGALNPNEIRESEDRNPYDGGEKFRVPLNMEDPSDEQDDPNADT